MALIKSLNRRGVTASYIYIESLRFSKSAKTASAIFGLCIDAEHRAAVKSGQTEPIEGHLATVRIKPERFDDYFGDGVSSAKNIESRIYTAIKEGGAEVKLNEGAEFLESAMSDE